MAQDKDYFKGKGEMTEKEFLILPKLFQVRSRDSDERDIRHTCQSKPAQSAEAR